MISSSAIKDEPKVEASLNIYLDQNRSTTNYEGYIGIEIRGRSSQSFDKQSFGFETRNPDGSNKNVELLGMPKENDWVLYGPYADRSLIRNALTFSVAQRMGHYAPRYRFCELVVNGDYRGIYLLTEKIKRDKNRVDLNSSTIDGEDTDYLLQVSFELDQPSDGWISNISYRPDRQSFTEYRFEYPKAQAIADQQASYIQAWMDNLESELTSKENLFVSDFEHYIDVNSWVDYIILNELTRDVDAYIGSTFLTKASSAKGGKLAAGPIWDLNLGYGNSDYCGNDNVEGLAIEFEDVCKWRVAPLIFARPWSSEEFRSLTAKRYFELRRNVLGPALFKLIDSLTTNLNQAQIRNFERWPIHGQYLWPNAFVGHTYQEDVNYLKDWIKRRLTYLDLRFSEYLDPPQKEEITFTIQPNITSPGQLYQLSLDAALDADVKVELFSASGQLLESANLPKKQRFLLKDTPRTPGTYIVVLSIKELGFSKSAKLIVAQ